MYQEIFHIAEPTSTSSEGTEATNDEVRSLALLPNNNLVVTFLRGGIHCFDIVTKQPRWNIPSKSFWMYVLFCYLWRTAPDTYNLVVGQR